LWKLVFVILLLIALVAAVAWFVGQAQDVISDTGTAARSALSASSGPVAAWRAASGVFGSSLALALTLAWAIGGAIFGVFFIFRLLRWVNGA